VSPEGRNRIIVATAGVIRDWLPEVGGTDRAHVSEAIADAILAATPAADSLAVAWTPEVERALAARSEPDGTYCTMPHVEGQPPHWHTVTYARSEPGAEGLADALCQAQEAGQHLDQVAGTTAEHWRGVANRTLPFLAATPAADSPTWTRHPGMTLVTHPNGERCWHATPAADSLPRCEHGAVREPCQPCREAGA
jgi:hypothetical protein